ncbi:MAG: amino acid permease [Hyphomicrobiaceae bacterium]|nr:amino acid permease [Hyphomicrobiaceae bacterium]
MVGIGVFTSLGFQVIDITSAFSVILLWVVGGIVALCGALSYAELAAALPRSGGEYNFLSRIYHPAVGFMAGWLSATVGFAAPIAIAAIAFGAYFNGVLPGVASPLWLGLLVAWGVALVHLTGLKQGTRFHNASTILKILFIVVFIIAGFAYGTPQDISFAPSTVDLTHISGAPFFIGLVFVMYSYSGWNASVYIIDEIHEPQRSVPRSLLLATLIVLVLYVGLNALFLYTTPMDKMAGQVEVALVAGKHIFGETGGDIVGALICFGLIATISAMTWIGPRVTKVMGEDLPLLGIFARQTRNGVPAAAIALQTLIVTVLILTQSFEKVVNYIQFAITLSSFLAVFGVIVLRFRRPDLARPVRTWGYPVTPIIFLLVTGFMMAYLLAERPVESLAGLATLLAGLVVYALSPKRKPDASQGVSIGE